eukprot:6736656-Prorocentrum_lima.AAC.1
MESPASPVIAGRPTASELHAASVHPACQPTRLPGQELGSSRPVVQGTARGSHGGFSHVAYQGI